MWNLSHVIVACRSIHVKNLMVLRKEVVEPIDPWSFRSLVWRGSYLHDLYTLFPIFRREWMRLQCFKQNQSTNLAQWRGCSFIYVYSWEGEFSDLMGILRAWHSCTNWDVMFWCLNPPGQELKKFPKKFKNQWFLSKKNRKVFQP